MGYEPAPPVGVLPPWPWIISVTTWGWPEIVDAAADIGAAAAAWPVIAATVLIQKGDAVPQAPAQAKPQPNQSSGRQARCTSTGINWELGLCTYQCEDGLPWAERIPAGNQCPNRVYKDWGK